MGLLTIYYIISGGSRESYLLNVGGMGGWGDGYMELGTSDFHLGDGGWGVGWAAREEDPPPQAKSSIKPSC